TGDPLASERLSIYRSTNALDFTLVSNTGFSGPSGALRDPSIMRHTDGQYYVAYTDPLGAGCCGKEDHFSIARSADLTHWTQLTTVAGGVPGVAHVWAPEWFVDGATVTIVANMDTLNTDSDFKPYIFTATSPALTTWSGPTALGIGPNYIDAFVMKTNGPYHVFAKNESPRYVAHATSAKMTGPWTFVGTGDWAGWGSGMEGPCVVPLDDGSWRIYLDGQHTGFLYSNSPDLVSWSKTSPLPMLTDLVRHGTVLRDPGLGGGGGAAGTTGAGTGGAALDAGANGGAGGLDRAASGGHAGDGATGGQSGAAGQGGATVGSGRGGAMTTTDTGGAGGTGAPDSAATGGIGATGGAALTGGAPGQQTVSSSGGCGCAITGGRAGWSQLASLALLGLLARRRGASRRGRRVRYRRRIGRSVTRSRRRRTRSGGTGRGGRFATAGSGPRRPSGH
ncbi:MAG: family 43 glycosylhydrolase, partial [Pseudomonadota bacterium]